MVLITFFPRVRVLGSEEPWAGLRTGHKLGLLVWRNIVSRIIIHSLGVLSALERWLEVLSSSLVSPHAVRGSDLSSTGAG